MNTSTQHIDRYFLSCDWGTSSFRLKLVAQDTGDIVCEISGPEGVKEIYKRWSAKKNSQNRVTYYRTFLADRISELKRKSQLKKDRLPLVVSGMASSTIGIKELPYRSLPIALDDPDLHVETFGATRQLPHTLHLISGICSRDDVMRGEETQLLGIYAKIGKKDGLYILAGTHSKHVSIENHAITSFRTYMTGELFDLLITESILSNSVRKNDGRAPGAAFKKGIKASLQENLLHSLFKIRAEDILHESKSSENYDFLSGLLIGTELKEICQHEPGHLILLSSSQLQRYYATALDFLKLSYTAIELTTNEDITSLGHRIILKQMDN